MVTRLRAGRDVLGQPTPVVPESWTARGGTEPEYFIFLAILRTGRKEPVDFIFQKAFFGGRLTRGGVVADFMIFSPRVAINVQGARFHLSTAHQRTNDRLQRAALEGSGIRMEFISDFEAVNGPDKAVREAIAGTRGRGPLTAFGLS